MMTRVMLRALLIPLLLGLSPIRNGVTSDGPENISFSDTESPTMDSIAARVAEKLVKTGNKLVAISQFHGDKTTDSHGYGTKFIRATECCTRPVRTPVFKCLTTRV